MKKLSFLLLACASFLTSCDSSSIDAKPIVLNCTKFANNLDAEAMEAVSFMAHVDKREYLEKRFGIYSLDHFLMLAQLSKISSKYDFHYEPYGSGMSRYFQKERTLVADKSIKDCKILEVDGKSYFGEFKVETSYNLTGRFLFQYDLKK